MLVEKITFSEKIDNVCEKAMPDKNHEEPKKGVSFRAVCKGIEIEDKYFNYLKGEIGSDYELINNVRVNEKIYDIIAQSKVNDEDLIYNIKYLGDKYSIPRVDELCYSTKKSERNYNRTLNRNAKSIIVVVTKEKCINRLNSNPSINEAKKEHSIEFEFISEEKLIANY